MSAEITFRYESGSARLQVPSDVAIEELLPEFVETAGEDATQDGWRLKPVAGPVLPAESTFGECGVRDGAVLVLERSLQECAPTAGNHRSESSAPVEPVSPTPSTRTRPAIRGTARAIGERTARTFPQRLTTAVRVREALRALFGRTDSPAPQRPAAGLHNPGAFALPPRSSPVERMREAWARTDHRLRLEEMILSPRLQRCVTIAVVSPKGGVGKTTTAALLGSLLAYLRRDRVVAVDANPDWGSLGRRLCPGHPVCIDDLLCGPLAKPHPNVIELGAHLASGPNGLMIAPAPTEPERASSLGETAYRTLFEKLAALVGTLVLDCGTGLDSPAARAALSCSNQLVLVTDPIPPAWSPRLPNGSWPYAPPH